MRAMRARGNDNLRAKLLGPRNAAAGAQNGNAPDFLRFFIDSSRRFLRSGLKIFD